MRSARSSTPRHAVNGAGKGVQQDTLFQDDSADGDIESPPPIANEASLLAAEVAERALRTNEGLGSAKHPVEIASIEPKTRRLTALGRKAWYLLVSYSLTTRPLDASDGVLWRVTLQKLLQDLRYTSRNLVHLRSTIDELQTTLVKWGPSAKRVANGDQPVLEQSQLLGSIQLVLDRNGRLCLEWTLPYHLHRHLQDYVHFYTLDLDLLVSCSRHSTQALLAEVSRHFTNPSGLTARRPWRDWIPILTGVSDEYAQLHSALDGEPPKASRTNAHGAEPPARHGEWRYFHRDVVQRAVKELNSLQTDFVVTPVAIRTGAFVTHLQFKIIHLTRHKKAQSKAPTRPEMSQLALWGVQESATKKFIEQYGMSAVTQAIKDVADDVARADPVIDNPAGLFVSKLRRLATTNAVDIQPAAPKVTAQQAQDLYLREYRNSLVEKFREEWPDMPSEVRDDYEARFVQHLESRGPEIVLSEARKSRLTRPIVRIPFFRWAAEDRAGGSWHPSLDDLLRFAAQARLDAPPQ